MTPREIIDKIKAHPAKERANEIMICHTVLEPLLLIQQKCFEQMQWCEDGIYKIYTGDSELHTEVRNNMIGQKEAYSDILTLTNSKIEFYENWLKNGNAESL